MEQSSPGHAFPAQFVILGLLTESPSHGYELRERFSSGLGGVWHVAMSQLYSVLRRLEGQGLIRGTRQAQVGKPERTVYRVTDKGRAAFLAWAASPVEHLRDLRVELFAKIYLLRRVEPARVAELVTAQAQTLKALQRHLDRRQQVETDDRRLSALTLDYRRAQVAGTLEWLDSHKEELVS